MRIRSVLVIVLLVFGFTWSKAALALEGWSPMPEEPGERGNGYVFYHELRDLRSRGEAMEERYPSRPHMEKMSDKSRAAALEGLRVIYEDLRVEYLDWRTRPDLANFTRDPFYVHMDGKILFPQKVLNLFAFEKLASQIFLSYFHALSNFSETLLTEEMDRRRATTIIFTTFYERGYTPLSSLVGLAQDGTKNRTLLETMLALRFQEAEMLSLGFRDAVKAYANAPESSDVNIRMSELWEMAEVSRYKIEVASRFLSNAKRFSNDLLNGRMEKTSSFSELRDLMVSVADSMVNILKEAKAIEMERAGQPLEDSKTPKSEGVRLVELQKIIPEMMRDRERRTQGRHVSVMSLGAPDILLFDRQRGEGKVFEILSEGLALTYIVAAGAVVSRLFDVKEVRGSIWRQAGIEARYQIGQTRALASRVRSSSRNPRSSEVIPVSEATSSGPVALSRRQIIGQRSRAQVADLEARLWTAFWDRVGQGGFNHQSLSVLGFSRVRGTSLSHKSGKVFSCRNFVN